MNIAEQTIVNLYETNCVSIEDIQVSLELPTPYIMDVLERKSAKYRALSKFSDNGSTVHVQANPPLDRANDQGAVQGDSQGEDITDKQFARIREEMMNLALAPDQNPFLKASCLKFLWNKKRPDGVQPINLNVNNINLALDRARKIRASKLQTSEPIEI